MAYAIDTVNGDGSKVEFDVTFDFISRDDVEVTRIATDGVRQLLTVIATGSPTGDEFVWESNDKIKVGTAPAVGEKLETKRDTPEDQQVVKWADGSYIIADDLNTSDLQLLYLIQELTDEVEIIGESTLVYKGTVDLTTDSQPPDPDNGDFYINIGAGTVLPSWAGIAGDAVVGGERIIYNSELRAWETAPPPKGQTIISDKAPDLGARGQIWWSNVEGKAYIWYEDSDSAQWVQFHPDTSAASNTPYTYPGGIEQTLQNRLEQYVSVADFGAKGDGVTDDKDAFLKAKNTGRRVWVPEGNYAINKNITLTGVWSFDANAKIIANANLTFEMSVNSGRTQIAEVGTGTIKWLTRDLICVEWLGVLPENTGAVNKANWENFLKDNPSTSNTPGKTVSFGRGEYEYEAPFYICTDISVEGFNFQDSVVKLIGTNQHGVETCESSGGAILPDGQMANSSNYSNVRNIFWDCTNLQFTGGTRKFMMYAAALSSSVVEGCRFQGPNTFENQMDGMFLGPTYASQVTDPDKNRSCLRNTIRNNRITQFRDGIVCGRYSSVTRTVDEPAGGGTGDYIGGAMFENTIGPRNYLCGNAAIKVRPRNGIIVNYYNTSGSSASRARPKPYAVNIHDNTVLEYTSSTLQLPGILTIPNKDATEAQRLTLTGIGTNFVTDLPAIGSGTFRRTLAIGFTWEGKKRVFEIDSIDSETQLTLKSKDVPTFETAITEADAVGFDAVNSGAGLKTGSEGNNVCFSHHYLDHWCYSIQLTSNAQGASVVDNHSAGSSYLDLSDASSRLSDNYIRIHTPGRSTRENGAPLNDRPLQNNYFKGTTTNFVNTFERGAAITINDGELNVEVSYHRVDTENKDPQDSCHTINGGLLGQSLILGSVSDSRTIVLRDRTDGEIGNLRLSGGDMTMANVRDSIVLMCTGDEWIELSRAINEPQ